MDLSPALSPEDAFVADLVASGRYADAASVWREAIYLLAEREYERSVQETAQLSLLHDVLSREADEAPLVPDADGAETDLAFADADAVLSEIELLLSAGTPMAFRKAG